MCLSKQPVIRANEACVVAQEQQTKQVIAGKLPQAELGL
jgi:hypothetical protein